MTQERKTRQSGTMGWLVVTGVAVLLALAVGPGLAGTASAAPAAQWAYGGSGNSTGTVHLGGTTITWNASFGWTVIFTSTNTSNSTVQLEEQRTVGIDVTTTVTALNASGSYTFHGTESDVAFANLTDAATVYVNGSAVPALGITNESLRVQAAVDQALLVSVHGHSHSGWLNVSGTAQGKVAFAPALGILPLNLSGVTMWNSSATATPSASWDLSYAWADLGWNGTTRSGSGSVLGNWSATGPVSLIGLKATVGHPFTDHQTRTAIILLVQGPVDAYDGYILVPHDFDLFGGASHPFDADSLGSASVGSGQGETLYLSPSARGPTVTAADTNFGASPGAASALAQPGSGLTPAVGATPGATVPGEPMSVSAAQAESACLTKGCTASTSATTGSLLGIALIAVAAIAVIGLVVVVEWRSYDRRRSQKTLVGGYGESWVNGVPPAVVQPPTPPVSSSTGPEAPPPRP
ncbi:MAG: hypothetical protein L3K10_07350 [Thermoplasmata archaeon]|nr:hypothetical protein [Thermoplasmata archaeon]